MSEEAAEMEFLQEDSGIDPNDVNRLAMLRLNNITFTSPDHHTTGEPQDPCTMCGSVKKRSPYSSSLQEPNPKRITLRPPSSSNPAADHHLHGFAKISVPPSNQTLFRCSSLPVHYPGLNEVGALDPQFPATLNNRTPENLKIGSPATKETSTSASLPILLRRTLSDPTPVYPPESSTPPRHTSARKSLLPPTTKGSSPNAKRLKRMKDRMKEMKQWCEELIREDVEEAEFEEDSNDKTPHQFDAELNGAESEPVETAWVEKTGESSIIHFKCPCGKDYQILLHGSNCYYMLMPFEQEKYETETQEMLSVERNGEWLSIFTQCPCSKGYIILLSGKDCYFKLIDNFSSSSSH